jgi:predicted lipoprotein with Yx(FWY)xxD motif
MKHKLGLVIAITLLAPAAVAVASTHARHFAQQATFFTLNLKKTSLGKILVNTSGSVLYQFTGDHPKKDTCVKIKGCASAWTPMPTTGQDSAGPGVKSSLISSIALPKPFGYRQVTYAGHPLYIFASSPTSTSYAGEHEYGHSWDAVSSTGKAVS